MGYSFSKSKYVAVYTRCHKYAWLDKYKKDEMEPVSEYTQYLFDNGHRVGDLAQKYFNVDVDVTTVREDGSLDLDAMRDKTQEHIRLGTERIAEASFSYKGFFCSVDILKRNPDDSYTIYEVKSSKHEEPPKTKRAKRHPLGVQDKYMVDAAYQQYVLANYGLNVKQVYVVLLNRDYVRGTTLDLAQYFALCDVTKDTTARQKEVEDTLAALEPMLADATTEPPTVFSQNCKDCPYWGYCSRVLPTPSPFDVYYLGPGKAAEWYYKGVSFFDLPTHNADLKPAALRQIAYYNRSDAYLDKPAVQAFLDTLSYPLYSLDFETYQASIPQYEGMHTGEQVPFQYSLHVLPSPDADWSGMEEYAFLDLSGADTRRAIAESLVERIPAGACVLAYHESTERSIVKRLAEHCPDLAAHLLSFTYVDPLKVFQDGHYYMASMGKSFSLKTVAPALYPDDPDMDYHNLEGNVKNGTQAMNVYTKAADYTEEERQQLEEDLKKYCALDTLAVLKIIKKLYEVV